MVRAPECLTALETASCAMRRRLYSTSGGRARWLRFQPQLQPNVLGFGDLARRLGDRGGQARELGRSRCASPATTAPRFAQAGGGVLE